MSSLVPIQDVERMAQAVAKSGLFGAKTPEQALSLMLIAQAEGKHPAMACQEYDIIQGRPALKSAAMLGRFQQAGGKVNWIKHEDDEVSAEFSHPQSPTPLLISWTMDRAKKAGIAGKDNWIKYPRQMLRARVISEGVRATYPASCSGLYTPEEIVDMDVQKVAPPAQAPTKSINTVEGLKETLKANVEEAVVETAPMTPEQIADDFGGEVIEPSLSSLGNGEEMLEFRGIVTGVSSRQVNGKDGKMKDITAYSVEDSSGNEFVVEKWGVAKENIEGSLATFISVRCKEFKGKLQYMCKDIVVN